MQEIADAGRRGDFNEALEKLTADIDKPYSVTASVGTALRKVVKQINLEDIISEADEMMYQHKTAKKCQRI